ATNVGRLCEGFDCDDDDNSVHQNAPEICDGQDNDCDGEADEALALNVCGGCEPLDAVPGDPCGPCGLDELICGNGMLGCDGETACPVPVVMASDGTRTDAVEVIWQEIEGADRYQVFRDGERIAELASDEPLRYEDRGAAEGGLPGVVEAVNATDGDYTDRVELTWQAAQAPLDGTPHAYTVVTLFGERPGSMSASDTGYRAAEPITGYAWSANGSPWRAASGALSAVDMGAPAPRIAPGVAMASDGTSYDAVELTLEGVTVEPGAAVTYQVRAETATGVGPASEPNEGYRGAGAPALVWERSARDMDGGYQALDALQTASARDTGAPIDGSGRYYRARVSSPGAQEATSSPDRGYRAAIVCGNSIEDPGEECDDGDREDNDGCNARCEMEFCGDGVPQDGLGEVCDDGVNDGSYGGCMPGCMAQGPFCGDGEPNGDEVCDDGVNDGSYGGCMPDCMARGPFCGDGEPNGDELCDDGNANDGDTCDNTCSPNGVVCGRVEGSSNGLLGTVVLSGTVTIDTNAGTIRDGSGEVVGAGDPGVTFHGQASVGPFPSPGIAVFHFAALTVAEGATVTVTGGRALALLATGSLVVEGALDLSGSAGTAGGVNRSGTRGLAGPGGWNGGNFVSGPGCATGNGIGDGPGRGTEGGCGTRGADGGDASNSGGGGGGGGSCGGSGGAGAGHAAEGGSGVDANPGTDGTNGSGSGGGSGGRACTGTQPGAQGGPAVGDGTLSLLLGGSGGSAGGLGVLGGFGGDGGDIDSGLGGFGGLGGLGGGAGAGGGGGGAVLLCATTVEIGGSIDVSGGLGGAGGFSDPAESGDNASTFGDDPRGGGGGAGRASGGGGGGGGAGGAMVLRAVSVTVRLGAQLNAGGGGGGFRGGSGSGGFGGIGRDGGSTGGRGGSGGNGGGGGDGSDGWIRFEAGTLLNSGILNGVLTEGAL
ncbi:MAG: MopE-related protein, partial [Myxococcota bacterium]